jgi:hypothetical protein
MFKWLNDLGMVIDLIVKEDSLNSNQLPFQIPFAVSKNERWGGNVDRGYLEALLPQLVPNKPARRVGQIEHILWELTNNNKRFLVYTDRGMNGTWGVCNYAYEGVIFFRAALRLEGNAYPVTGRDARVGDGDDGTICEINSKLSPYVIPYRINGKLVAALVAQRYERNGDGFSVKLIVGDAHGLADIPEMPSFSLGQLVH